MSYKSMLIDKIKRYKDPKNYDLVKILKGPGRILWTRAEEEKCKALIKLHGFWGQAELIASHFKGKTKMQVSGLRHRLYNDEIRKKNPD